MTPFVQSILALWDTISAHAHAIRQFHEHHLSEHNSLHYTSTGQGVQSDAGNAHYERRLVAAGGAPIQAHLTGLKTAFADLHAQLRPYPILGGNTAEIRCYHNAPSIGIGPWGRYTFHIDTPAKARAFIATLAGIAERDGTTQGAPISLSLGGRHATIHANDSAHAKALYVLCQESHLVWRYTGATATPSKISVPTAQPHALPTEVWDRFWAALHALRSAGVRNGCTSLHLHQGQHVAETGAYSLAPAVRKAHGLAPHDTGLPSALRPQMDTFEEALLALTAAMRQAAPILTAFDAWALDVPVADIKSHLSCGLVFSWGPKAQSLMAMGAYGPWNGPHPVRLCNQAVFSYTLERALGALSTFTHTPTRAWQSPQDGQIYPGDTIQDAARLMVALACGNKPSFVPGAPIPASQLPSGAWREAVPLA